MQGVRRLGYIDEKFISYGCDVTYEYRRYTSQKVRSRKVQSIEDRITHISKNLRMYVV